MDVLLITAFIIFFDETRFKFDEMTTYMFSMYNFCIIFVKWGVPHEVMRGTFLTCMYFSVMIFSSVDLNYKLS